MSEHKQNFDDGVDEAGLLALADHVEQVKPELFDMGQWGRKTACGMVCCIGGHAATIHPMLVLTPNQHSSYHSLRWTGGGECGGPDAIARAYRLDVEAAVELTHPGNAWTNADAAAALRRYVATRELPE